MAGAEEQRVQVRVCKDLSTVTLGNTTVEVDARGKTVSACTSESAETVATAPSGAATGALIKISNDFKTVVVNGITIEHAPNEHIVITAPGAVITKTTPANDTRAAGKELHVGDRMEDGTVFAGISPDTKAPMYATPQDAPLTMKWQDAMNYAAGFEGCGSPKGTFRIPTSEELGVLYENRAKIGGFYQADSLPANLYWSSTADYQCLADARLFNGGQQYYNRKDSPASVRLVRD